MSAKYVISQLRHQSLATYDRARIIRKPDNLRTDNPAYAVVIYTGFKVVQVVINSERGRVSLCISERCVLPRGGEVCTTLVSNWRLASFSFFYSVAEPG